MGGWATSDSQGEIVSASGASLGAAYSGQGFRFYDDGTYLYRIAGSGLVISGLSETLGHYRVDGDTLTLYDNKESFYSFTYGQWMHQDEPADDVSYLFTFEDDGTTLALENDFDSMRLHKTD